MAASVPDSSFAAALSAGRRTKEDFAMSILRPSRALTGLLLLAAAPAAHAQWAVIDVGAIAQLVREVAVMENALATAQGELRQAEQTYRSMTGDRGMASLLSGTKRNYLPSSSSELEALLEESSSTYGAVASAMRGVISHYAVLTPGQLDRLPPDAVGQLETARRRSALMQAIAGDALSNSSDRFTALQRLIDAISAAGDQKASLDLQARISAEQAMLENEQTKLEVLFEAMKAQKWLDGESEREQIVADHGDFRSRFAPTP
jgi:type IV secretion system protein VirB5